MIRHLLNRDTSSKPSPVLLTDRSDPESVYTTFLAAIAARDVNQVICQSTETLNASLRLLRCERDFSVLFDLWCDSYPTRAHINSCHINGTNAMLDVEMIVGGERLFATITLLRVDGAWHVHHEQFYRCRPSTPVAGRVTNAGEDTSSSEPRSWLDLVSLGRAWPKTHVVFGQV